MCQNFLEKKKQFFEIQEQLKKEVVTILNLTREVQDEQVYAVIDEVIITTSKKRYLSLEQMQRLRKNLFNSIRRFDVLQELLDQEDVTEIMINGYEHIFIEREGKITKWTEGFSSKEKFHDVIQQIVSGANRTVNEASPIVDARLPDGSRVHVVLEPIALDGSALTIRKFSKEAMGMERLIQFGALDSVIADVLKLFVRSGMNIFISGGTGSGKTTFLNALSSYIEEEKRVITIEDSAELHLMNLPNLVRLESRNANLEGGRAITIRNLLKASLRMRPDFIVIGEIRGEEALDLLQALNTGHSGFSTGHANSSKDMLSRIETMVLMGMEMPLLAIRGQIASAIDIIVHLGRLRDRSRKVLEVSEVLSVEEGEIQMNPLFQFEEIEEIKGEIKGQWKQVGVLHKRDKLMLSGFEGEYEAFCYHEYEEVCNSEGCKE